MGTVTLVLLGLLSVISVSLQRTYSKLSLKELKRRAREGDDIAVGLSRATSYGQSLNAILWALVGITSAVFFVAVSRRTPVWFAFSSIATVLWLSYVWLPATRVSYLSEKLASFAAPVFVKALHYLDPVIKSLLRLVHKYKPIHIHTGLYDRLDLLELLERQQVQPDNRIEKTELEIAMNALKFGDIKIGDRMIPRRKVKLVSSSDSLGPIIMDELHASGFSRFPVYEGKQDNIVGTLFLHDLVRIKDKGTVGSNMRKEVYFLHEDQSLNDGLQAVLKTHRHLFVVVNKFEEFVGIITSEDILESIVGKPIIDEFDNYDNLRAVAAREANRDHDEHAEHEVQPEQEPKAEAEAEPKQDEIETIEFDNTQK
jgi:putative hemolysin